MARFPAAQALDQIPVALVAGTAMSRDVSRAVKAGKQRKLVMRQRQFCVPLDAHHFR